jgi:SAM-dependent methyltransferase
MNTAQELKEIVRQKYGAIAEQMNDGSSQDTACGCGPSGAGLTSCCDSSRPEGATTSNVPILMAQSYDELTGYAAQADLGLGCGLPTQFAKIKPGNVVVDLGSGAGNDCFVARAETGETGRVIGLDMTPAMIDRARHNAKALGFANVEFVYGDIEDMPLPQDLADVVVSNCVMNLVPDKQKAFSETYRILKPGGHFSISDIVLEGELPAGLQRDAELYVGCVSGAIQKQTYLQLVQEAGFENIIVQKEREIALPIDVLQQYLTPAEIVAYQPKDNGMPTRGIYSITVFAQKPLANESGNPESVDAVPVLANSSCCGPECCN